MSFKGRSKAILLVVVLVTFVSAGLSAQTIKLGSPFPETTEWHYTLMELAAEWSDITNGRVRLRIYPGGVAGGDADMVRKMRIKQLDAAVLTSFGMKSIVPDSFVMTLPGTIQSEEELDMILRDFAPRFDEEFIDEGFRVLSWSKTGWAYLFTDRSDPSVNSFRRDTLGVNSSDEELVAAFKAIGFKVVPIAMNETMVGLQSGMIENFYAPPMGAGAYQWFALAPHMIDFPISPVVGGLVISERTWNRIPAQYRDELKASVEEVVSRFYNESVRLNEKAMDEMYKHDLEVLTLTDAEREEWYDVLQDGVDFVVGDDAWISQEVYDDYINLLEDMR